jgi:hypothetical protein
MVQFARSPKFKHKSVTAAEGKDMTTVLLEFIRSYVSKNSPKGRRK